MCSVLIEVFRLSCDWFSDRPLEAVIVQACIRSERSCTESCADLNRENGCRSMDFGGEGGGLGDMQNSGVSK
jgi:hypothetical protein